jgi:hypothetical protein
MSIRSQILTGALLTGVAMAQGAPASQTVKSNPAQPAVKTGTPAKSVAKSPFAPKAKVANSGSKTAAKTQVAAKPANPSPVSNAKQIVTVHNTPKTTKASTAPTQAKATPKPLTKTPVQAKATPKPVNKTPIPEKPVETAPAIAQSAPLKLPSPGKRDPFQNPLAAAASRGPGAGCATGKRCLVVDQIVLKGIVQMKAGNFALVENTSKHPYVLHENDSLFNGSVVKITGDTVILREDSSDILGRPVSKEVVKKVSAPAV